MGLLPSARDLSDAIARREEGHWDPVMVSRDRYILAGYAQWIMARKRNERAIPGLRIEVSGDEALLWLIQRHKRTSSLNDFARISLALELEPMFKERASSNQRLGGEEKGSSNLTEAERIDVRSQIAKAAGVSTGNVSKVKMLLSTACPPVLQALRDGEVSIHRALGWKGTPERQEDALRLYRNQRGIKREITRLLTRHRHSQMAPDERLDMVRIARAILDMAPDRRALVAVGELAFAGHAVLVSSSLLNALERQGDLSGI